MHSLSNAQLLIYIAVVGLYSFFTIFFSYKAYDDFLPLTNDFSLLIENWSKDVIVDVNNFGTIDCPPEYEPLVTYLWPGTKNGCNCIDITAYSADIFKVKKQLTEGFCSFNQTEAGCNDVHNWPGHEMNYWAEGKVWCFKRAQGINFLKLTPLKGGDGKCPKDFFPCGDVADIDSIICVPMAGENATVICPITSLRVGPLSANSTTGVESILFRSEPQGDLYMNIRRGSNKYLPISEIRISQGKICRNNKEQYKDPVTQEYKLIKQAREVCMEPDNRFTVVDSLGELDFFNSNGLPLEKSLPHYPLMVNNGKWNIYSRTYIRWASHCNQKINDLVKYNDELQSLSYAQWYLYLLSLIVISIVFATCLIFCLTEACGRDNPNYFKVKTKLRIINYLFRILNFPVAIVSIIYAKNSKNFFAFFDESKCSDTFTNKLFSEFANNIGLHTLSYDITVLSLIIIMALIDFGLFLLLCYKKKVHENEQDESNKPFMELR